MTETHKLALRILASRGPMPLVELRRACGGEHAPDLHQLVTLGLMDVAHNGLAGEGRAAITNKGRGMLR